MVEARSIFSELPHPDEFKEKVPGKPVFQGCLLYTMVLRCAPADYGVVTSSSLRSIVEASLQEKGHTWREFKAETGVSGQTLGLSRKGNLRRETLRRVGKYLGLEDEQTLQQYVCLKQLDEAWQEFESVYPAQERELLEAVSSFGIGDITRQFDLLDKARDDQAFRNLMLSRRKAQLSWKPEVFESGDEEDEEFVDECPLGLEGLDITGWEEDEV